jgi:CRP/FNR family transcriptional regulator, cyclic AMP receptor protein
MSILSNMDLIRRVPLFAMLTSEQAALLSGAVTKRRFKRGELIVEQGKKSNALFIILAGRARVLMSDQKDRQVILANLKAGDFIGEMGLIDNEPHSASVEAEVQTDVLVLGCAEFSHCLQENLATSLAVMKGLVQRLRKADDKIGSLALMNVYGRVAEVLIGFAAEDVSRQSVIREKISRQDIAKMVGASRETVSRVMRDFEDSGLISTSEEGFITVNERRTIPR